MVANLSDALESSTLKRRKLIGLSLGVGLGAFGLGTLVAFAGGLIKNPWKPVVQTADGKKAVLWTSGWTPRFDGETIYVARATGNGTYAKMRPEDIDAGGMETVFPWRESDGDGTTIESHHRLSEITMGVRNPVMLIRIKPTDLHEGRQAQEPRELQLRRPVRVHQGVLAPGLPLIALRAAELSHPLPVPPVAVRRAALCETHIRPGCARACAVAHHD